MEEADFVIVGAGSAGCVLANRLSAETGTRVVLLEAGPRDTNPWIHIPVGYFRTMHNPAVDWCFKTEPDPGLNGRSIAWPRGRVLGGSSSINGLLYVRGQPQDYDRWRQMGCTGWGWDDVLPLFKRAEGNTRGGDALHGADGPLTVSDPALERPICAAWNAAAVAAGYPENPDYNGPSQEGVGYFQVTTRGGLRCSAAKAYLKPAMKRSSLRVITGALALGIEMDGRRATGVRYRGPDGTRIIRAAREVILCGGSINSPHLLMLSGIGDAEHLRDNGVTPAHDLSGVGQNLQDHLQARPVWRCMVPTLNDEVQNLWQKARIAAQYALTRRGPMTMAASLGVAFLRTRPELETPDIQFHIQPWSAERPGEGPHPFSAFTASVCQLRPESRGHIALAGPDPVAYPKIHPNYLATQTDCDTIVAGLKIARDIAGHIPLAGMIAGEEKPGRDVGDNDLLQWARDTAVSIYHPTGTCKMGPGDGAVVGPDLRVHGIQGLRVADASIMPEIVSGNTNAPAIMIGEKASDLVLSEARVR
ncbi:MAG: GMC family oxidoreductase N-terminal domain-containing protein [Pseudomonadota bacterium]